MEQILLNTLGLISEGLGLDLGELYAARWADPMVAGCRCSGMLAAGYGACSLSDNGISEGEETAL